MSRTTTPKKKTTRKADLILSADWHVREDTPVCRSDDYLEAMGRKFQYLRELQLKHDCQVVVAGDVFHKAKPSPFLIGWAMSNLPHASVIAGQHDLPNHNLGLFRKCGLYVLELSGCLSVLGQGRSQHLASSSCVLQGFPWGVSPEKPQEPPEEWGPLPDGTRRVALVHVLTWTRKKPWPDIEADMAGKVLQKFKGFDLVVTGDNHQSFTVEHKGRLLVNPGSLLRSTADQADFRPRVYLWYADTNTVEPVYLPIEDVISREHLKKNEQRDERMEAFVKRLKDDFEVGLSFERNLEAFFRKNKTRKAVRELIDNVVGGDE